MNINSAVQISVQNLWQNLDKLEQNANQVATLSTEPTREHSGQNASLEAVFVENFQIEYEMQASALVIRTADEMLGTLINTRA